MGKALAKRPDNLAHNVPSLLKQGQHSLTALAAAYFVTEVACLARGDHRAARTSAASCFFPAAPDWNGRFGRQSPVGEPYPGPAQASGRRRKPDSR